MEEHRSFSELPDLSCMNSDRLVHSHIHISQKRFQNGGLVIKPFWYHRLRREARRRQSKFRVILIDKRHVLIDLEWYEDDLECLLERGAEVVRCLRVLCSRILTSESGGVRSQRGSGRCLSLVCLAS
jgi:hypothetical protein